MENYKDIWVAVYGAIFNSNNQLLIVKRADHDTMPGMWEIPGGSLEYNEKVDDAIAREVKEEAGLDVDVLHPILVHSGPSSRVPEKQVLRIAFECLIKDQNQVITLSPDHSEYKWMSLEDKEGLYFSEFLEDMLKNSRFIKKLVELGE